MNRQAPIGKAGLELIKSYEKFSATVYPDQSGHPTIGYGHKIKPEDNYGGMPLEMDQALLLLQRDVAWATDAITRLVDADVLDALNQNQYDALVSLIFNIGVGAFQESTLLSILNDGAGTLACRIDMAGLEFPRWNKATIHGEKVVSDGLVRRREAERVLWLTFDQSDAETRVQSSGSVRVELVPHRCVVERKLQIAMKALDEIRHEDGTGLDMSPAGPCHHIASKAMHEIEECN